ncbi:hypothetical protein CPB84DRAFT_1950354 [Gymnopilus junonius]|uniref:C2H2-type domain-containing protein n=1 Tax=Gymnopilus junonius TaxID=109634 RepID=A0A9P5NIY1_GYMJU|nr:hypothetical protein CPB84DRAFT_1950354 [Gymnopilus junonius]
MSRSHSATPDPFDLPIYTPNTQPRYGSPIDRHFVRDPSVLFADEVFRGIVKPVLEGQQPNPVWCNPTGSQFLTRENSAAFFTGGKISRQSSVSLFNTEGSFRKGDPHPRGPTPIIEEEDKDVDRWYSINVLQEHDHHSEDEERPNSNRRVTSTSELGESFSRSSSRVPSTPPPRSRSLAADSNLLSPSNTAPPHGSPGGRNARRARTSSKYFCVTCEHSFTRDCTAKRHEDTSGHNVVAS